MGDLFKPLKKQENKDAFKHLPASSYWKESWERLKCNPSAKLAMVMLVLLTFFAIFGPWMTGYTYYETHLELRNSPPSSKFWFGSDELGRDLFTRIWWGARISLFVGFSAAFIDLILGVIYGSISGFFGGKIDEIMMRIADVLFAIPYLLVVILLMVVIGPGITSIILALTITGWIGMARTVRGLFLQLREMEYVKAAEALGATPHRQMVRHLLPNAMGPIITTVTLTIPTAIFAEAFLSFLGLGIQAPFASWGTMANDGLPAMRYFPWRLFFPAFFISITMLSFNILGDALRDAFDPRLKR